MIQFDAGICTNLQESSSREWLETNGIGGFASSTISGINTRRYHGLLTAAVRPPLGRVTLLSKFEETVHVDGKKYDLSANQYPLMVNPDGYKFLTSFRLDPFPVWEFEINGNLIEKQIFMVHGQNSTVCRWSQVGGSDEIQLELKPLFSFADYHALQHESQEINLQYEEAESLVAIEPANNLPGLYLAHNAKNVEQTGYWYRNFEYGIEKERGFDSQEDLFQPFRLKFDLNESATVIVSTEQHDVAAAAGFEKGEIERRSGLIDSAGVTDDFEKSLVLAADQFIVKRGEGETIIAGYPWFSDWGRDTMISLNGLTLATNRPDIAKNILREFSLYVSEGMLPNRFPDEGDVAEYNTVDASLWYFEAVRAYIEKTGDAAFIESEIYPKLVEIIVWHLKGTRYNIHVDTDGLIFAGEEGSQLTWMDAKVGDTVITPRIGKPVEIQALWYNALCIMADLADRFNDRDGRTQYSSTADIARENFNQLFWNEELECLYDVVGNGEKDASIRPNQILAVSLPHSMLSIGRARKIVERVEAELLTPFGLRSLSPEDGAYHSVYIGSPFERDSAYHQGTVWGWMIGPFIDAYRRVCPNGNKTDTRVAEILGGFKRTLTEDGIGQISEVYDGDYPHKARGCFAQAWSVAEVLRSSRF